MLSELLNNENLLVRVGTAAAVTFLPLYLLADMGYSWAVGVAALAFITILFRHEAASIAGHNLGKIARPGVRGLVK